MNRGTWVYIGGFELPDKNAAAHRVLSNAKIIRELDDSVVFIGIDKNLEADSCILDTRRTVMGFETYSIPYPKKSVQWLSYLKDIDNFITVSKQYPDLKGVICYNYQAVSLNKILYYCRERNLKVLADCTEWYATRRGSLPFKLFKRMDSFYRMRILHRKVDGLIVISTFLKDIYKNKKCIILPPLVDLSEDKWKSHSAKSLDDTRFKLIYAGRPGPNKDRLEDLIEALNPLLDTQNFQLTVVGLTLDEYLQKYNHQTYMVSEFGDKLVFKGNLSHRACIKLIQESHYSLFLRESTRVSRAGFPTKFSESVCCATPVITNHSSDLGDYLVQGKNGYFIDNKDIPSITDNFSKILSLGVSQSLRMKEYCANSTVFDYHQYKTVMKDFLSNIHSEKF